MADESLCKITRKLRFHRFMRLERGYPAKTFSRGWSLKKGQCAFCRGAEAQGIAPQKQKELPLGTYRCDENYSHQNLDRGRVRMGTGTVAASCGRLVCGPETHSIHWRQSVNPESTQTDYQTSWEVLECRWACECGIAAGHYSPQTVDYPIR